MSGLTLSKCYHLPNEILSFCCCLLSICCCLLQVLNLLSLSLRFCLRFFCLGFQPLEILPSQPLIELVALASVVKQILEWQQAAEVPRYEGMCLTLTTLGQQSLYKSFPTPLLVLVLSKWLPFHPSKTMICQVCIYLYGSLCNVLQLSWHLHFNP
jgi:hypothetical protein